MVDELHLEKFKKAVCTKLCRICKDPDPTFCCSIALGDPDRFVEIMKHIILYSSGTSIHLKELKSFSGFCRLFCNFYRDCPLKSAECEELDSITYCFGLYVAQDKNKLLSIADRAKIFGIYSGISIKEIGKSIPIKILPLDDMKKKRKKKMSRLLEAMRHAIKIKPTETRIKLRKKKKEAKKPKKVVTTSWFWNDNDSEWRTWLLTRLGNETDNRQLDNVAEHPTANDGLASSAAND
jgi:hypothetical protein